MGYLLFSGIEENSLYFVTVAEARALTDEKLVAVRLFGVVEKGGIRPTPNNTGVRFFLKDQQNGEDRILVEYEGILPDAFKSGAPIIIEGSLGHDTGEASPQTSMQTLFPGRIFAATLLMTQCPSKYEKATRQ